ncbi:MAG: adenylate/guanylate cyclase domain-containing protein [Rhodospirillales bacterium]
MVDWLLAEGRLLPELDQIVLRLGQTLLAAGAPLWRLRLSTRTLHPLIAAFTSVWNRDSEVTERTEARHGLEGRSGYLGSPLETIARTGSAFRKRLSQGLTAEDHEVLHDLRARGGTDYLGLPMRYSDGTLANLVFTTDRAGGFCEADIVGFEQIAAVMAPIAEVFATRRMALAVAETYLGPRSGRRVLEGQITRGHIDTIEAAILVSDIRDWTGLSARLSTEAALSIANAYFEIVSRAVAAEGGEVLKLIGDGVLAVFPVGEGELSVAAACERALAAASRSLRSPRSPDLRFGIGLHVGEVLYGNVGSAERLDFTVMGQAVNLASRIEGLCERLGEPLLYSQAFADRLAGPSQRIAEAPLKGHSGRFAILTAASTP